MKYMRIAMVYTCVGVLAGCGGSSSSPMATVPTPTPAPGGTPNSTVMISMPVGASFLSTTAYVPNPVTVAVGTAVTWINNDNVAHTTTSQNNVWASPDMEPGSSYSRTFQSTGSFPYYCIYHPGMVGTIIVQ
jgi:plastocyanin